MKRIILLGIFIPFFSFSQTENKIEGLIFNAPCDLEYTRNLGNQNNYSCVIQDNDEKIFQYSVTVQNLFEDMKGMSQKTLEVYKEQFFKTAKENAESNNENTEWIVLKNGLKALKIKAYLTYSDQKFVNTSILFLYKQKSFIVNLTTNNLTDSASQGIKERIIFK